MSRTELSIDESYCDGWGLFEGIREFAQNGRDATRTGCSFDMVYHATRNSLSLITKGAILTPDTLLLGTSSKRNVTGMLGYWGEGYKIGSLALLRIGKRIRIRTGSELWEPEISHSKKFKRNVLAFCITGNKTHRNEIAVEIGGVTQDEWDGLKHKFLFLGEHEHDVVETKLGSVLLNGKGRLFVDGIHVCDSDYDHGYDFPAQAVKLDRDRRLIDSYDARHIMASIWENLYLDGKFEDEVDRMLAADVSDVHHFRYTWIVSTKVHNKIAQQFVKKHGESAVPARSMDDVRGLSLYGKKGEIVASATLREILESQIGTAESVKNANRDVVTRTLGIDSLSETAVRNLLLSTKMVSEAAGIMLPYEIVEFADASIVGMHKLGVMYLSTKVLESFEETLKTVVEEVAHTHGADGTREFQEALHSIYTRMVIQNMKLPT